MLLNVGGENIIVDEEILQRSEYFKMMLQKHVIEEIDNDPGEFKQLIKFLKGETTNPGPLGDFYMCGPGKSIISKEKNIIEWAEKPLTINTPNLSADALQFLQEVRELTRLIEFLTSSRSLLTKISKVNDKKLK